MVYPVNNIQNPELSNLTTEFENGTAIGMPPIHYHNRKVPPISNLIILMFIIPIIIQ